MIRAAVPADNVMPGICPAAISPTTPKSVQKWEYYDQQTQRTPDQQAVDHWASAKANLRQIGAGFANIGRAQHVNEAKRLLDNPEIGGFGAMVALPALLMAYGKEVTDVPGAFVGGFKNLVDAGVHMAVLAAKTIA